MRTHREGGKPANTAATKLLQFVRFKPCRHAMIRDGLISSARRCLFFEFFVSVFGFHDGLFYSVFTIIVRY